MVDAVGEGGALPLWGKCGEAGVLVVMESGGMAATLVGDADTSI